MISERITARGHPNLRAKHETTFEFTREHHLTVRGDCIVAVSADRGMNDFSKEFKRKLRDGCRLMITLECDGLIEEVNAWGHPGLTFSNPIEMVVRKSEYVCPRTLAVRADKSASDFSRKLVDSLKQGHELNIKLEIL
ncbi:MAG: DUF371 domain-containing protein [Candidatus Altiarchaeota archaeon]